jgi:peptidoglycan/xylan/chitin deacetylase (PgdA/CDA1 family)
MGFRVYLAERGYRIAGVTASFADYEWNEPYARCEAKHDGKEIHWLERSYLKAAEEDIGYRRAMSQKLLGADIPYVLLMHIGAFDARMLPRLLRVYQERGFTFVTLEEAEKDPFYKYDVDPKLLPGPDTLEGAMLEKHLPLPQKKDFSAELEKVCK